MLLCWPYESKERIANHWCFAATVMMLAALSEERHAPDDVRSHSYLESEVRRLLRRAANPFLLAANPLAQALCEATTTSDAQAALRTTIERAFRGGFQERRLGEMLLRSIE